MEDFETLNDTVKSIEESFDELEIKVDNNTEALQEVNNTVNTKSTELESKIHSFDGILSEAVVHISTLFLIKNVELESKLNSVDGILSKSVDDIKTLNHSLNTTNVNLQNSINRIDILNSTTSMYP